MAATQNKTLALAAILIKRGSDRICRSVDLVGLNDRDAGRVVFAPNDRRVGARGEVAEDGCFLGIGGRDRGCLDLGCLSVLPIIVRRDHLALAIEQLESRILESPRERKTRTDGEEKD